MVKICVIGIGYVGLIASVGLSEFGNNVIGVDLDEDKISRLREGESPIYEPGVEEYLSRNLRSGRLTFSTDLSFAVSSSDVVFIAVGTPPKPNGEADLKYIESAIKTIAENLNSYKVIVTKSTVPIGINRWIKKTLDTAAPDAEFDVVSNPEFLREGKAVQDFFNPDRTVIGYESERALKLMKNVYRALNRSQIPFDTCSLETAELIKYAANAFLATKISFVNELANLAEAVGADIHHVTHAMGQDGRISAKFLHPGPGYGGSCLPKDTRALVDTAQKHGVNLSVVKSGIEANKQQKDIIFEKLKTLVGGNLTGKKIALLGLAFKQETDDIRESPALYLLSRLLEDGVDVAAYDPKAAENTAVVYPDVYYADSVEDALTGADAVVIATEWNEFRSLTPELFVSKMRGRVIYDTRNLLEPEYMKSNGLNYSGLGRN